mmetsp:Transcript_47914/g.75736  ORF Transcript_47914/g.75736 Transcript_47914/m.75736 type:complete len:226 (-) Transcript_47914:858-1535(-)
MMVASYLLLIFFISVSFSFNCISNSVILLWNAANLSENLWPVDSCTANVVTVFFFLGELASAESCLSPPNIALSIFPISSSNTLAIASTCCIFWDVLVPRSTGVMCLVAFSVSLSACTLGAISVLDLSWDNLVETISPFSPGSASFSFFSLLLSWFDVHVSAWEASRRGSKSMSDLRRNMYPPTLSECTTQNPSGQATCPSIVFKLSQASRTPTQDSFLNTSTFG